jgi:hypothetical protein
MEPKFDYLFRPSSLLILVSIALIVFEPLSADVLEDAKNLLSTPKLAPNADLMQHNPPGAPLVNDLATARERAPSLGIAWKGIRFTAHDSPMVGATNENVLRLYRAQACLADGVFLGRVYGKHSHLSTTGSAIYTDYAIKVTSIIKARKGTGLSSRDVVVVSRIGGEVVHPLGPLRYDSQEFPELLSTEEYLFFAKRVDASESYVAIDNLSTLVLSNGQWRVMRMAARGLSLPEFRQETIANSVQMWLSQCQLKTRLSAFMKGA